MTDSTLIKAKASLDSLANITPHPEKINSLKGNGINPPTPRKLSNSTHQSVTDPDASLAHKKGTAQTLKYKVHQSIDDYKRVILDCFVTTGAVHESQVYMDRLEHILKSYSIDLKEVVADRAYGSGELLTQISKKQIRSYIPLFSSRSGSAFPSLEKEFYYDTYRDIFTCPSQVVLAQSSYVDKGIKIYRAPLKDCRACLQKSRCHAHIMKKSGRRYVLRSIFQELYNQVVQDMKRPEFIKKLKERMWKIEGIMAEAKNIHGLGQAKYRRREKVQIQAYMTTCALNLKRLQLCP